MTAGLVSVIMPTYNCGKFIAESIKSIQDQTYKNWELIIVDDCSEDDTKFIIDEIMQADDRIAYYSLTENSGVAVARTEAMKRTNGEFIAFCDSDDLWLPEKLEKQLSFMRENACAFSCTAYEHIDEAGKGLNKIIHTVEKADYARVLLDCPVGNSTVMYSVAELGKFEVPDIRKRSDDALWLRMLKKEQYIWGMPEILMKYRVRKDSVSINKLKLLKYHWILYREIEHMSVFSSLSHIGYWCFIKVFGIK